MPKPSPPQRSSFPNRRPILLLGLVSLFTDMASEMLYPVAPIYLTLILGAGPDVLGLLEGTAELVAGFLKGYFGAVSDRSGVRAPFVRAGYALSALAKPLPGIWASVAGVVTGRLADRLGKGMRTAPRDALLAGYAGPTTQGAVFGFHRMMDTLGAVLGPLLALLFLHFYRGAYRELFLLAFIPSILAVVTTFFVKDTPFEPRTDKSYRPFSVFAYWRKAPSEYRKLVAVLTLFSFVNSSDVFLVLKAQHVGFSSVSAIGGYVVYNLVYALAAYPLGELSDRVGKKPVLTGGLVVYVLVYFGFAGASEAWQAWVLFAFYGMYAAATEGVAKAWIAQLVPNAERGTALGLMTMLSSFGAFFASLIAGLLWKHVNMAAPFMFAALGALVTLCLLTFIVENRDK